MEEGCRQIAAMLDQVVGSELKTTVLLETMAGKGSEIGGRFEELRRILDLAACLLVLSGEAPLSASALCYFCPQHGDLLPMPLVVGRRLQGPAGGMSGYLPCVRRGV